MVAAEQYTHIGALEIQDQMQLILHEATNFDQTIAIWKAENPDIIVLPIFLDGQGVLPLIQSCLVQNPNIQIVVIVDRDQINNAAMAMRAGVVDCLFRPFSAKRLKKTIHEAKRRLEAMSPAPEKIQRARAKQVSVQTENNLPPHESWEITTQTTNQITPENTPEGAKVSATDILTRLLEGQTLAQIERLVIENAIEAANGSVTRAAKALDVAPSTLYRKLQGWSDPSD